jgi:hypothetical protein
VRSVGHPAVSANCFVPVVCLKSVHVNSGRGENTWVVITHIEKMNILSTLPFHLGDAFDEIELIFQSV